MAHRDALQVLRTYLTSQILGQETLVERLLIAVLAAMRASATSGVSRGFANMARSFLAVC